MTAPALNGVVGRLLGYRHMWLYTGILYMVTMMISPICALTIYEPEWVMARWRSEE